MSKQVSWRSQTTWSYHGHSTVCYCTEVTCCINDGNRWWQHWYTVSLMWSVWIAVLMCDNLYFITKHFLYRKSTTLVLVYPTYFSGVAPVSVRFQEVSEREAFCDCQIAGFWQARCPLCAQQQCWRSVLIAKYYAMLLYTFKQLLISASSKKSE